MFFHQLEGKCVDTWQCPSDPTQQKPCVHFLSGEKFGVEGSCSKYKECVYEDGKGDWVPKKCADTEYFDNEYRDCLEGHCQGCYEPAPWYADCGPHTEDLKFGHMYDCQKYFVCKKNLEECEGSGWGRQEGSCPDGQFFDVSIRECSPGTECPQRCPPKAEETSECARSGRDIKGNCKVGGTCSEVETCPGNCYKKYRSLEKFDCSGDDEYYDDRRQKCVKQFQCPKEEYPTRDCPVYWDLMGAEGFNARLVEDESWCRVFVGGWKNYEFGILGWWDGWF